MNTKNTPWKLLLGAITFAVFVDLMIYQTNNIGINFVFIQLVFLTIVALLARQTEHKIPQRAWIAAGFAIAFAATFAVWTSDISFSLNLLGLIFSNFFFGLFTLGHYGKFNHPIYILTDGIKHIFKIIFTRIQIITHFKTPSFSDDKSAVTRGIMITIPILIIFSALFLGSDLILQERASGLTSFLKDFFGPDDIVAHIFIIGSISTAMLLFFASVFWRRFEPKIIKDLKSMINTESLIVLVGSSILFLAFIIFQGVYLFGGQTAFDGIEAITYSEYAVKGFNELATVAVLVLGLILTLRLGHAEKVKNKLVLTFETILLSETVLILISAWIRLKLYVAEYGFTPSRLFGFWFFIVMTVILSMLIYNILLKKKQYQFLQKSFIFIGVAILIFTMSAPDALSVKLNLARGEKQYEPFPLFNQLTAEAYPIMNRVLTSDKYSIGLIETVPTDYCSFLNITYSYERDPKIPQKIRSFSLKEYNRNNELELSPDLLQNLQTQRNIARFQNHWNKKHFKLNKDYRYNNKNNPQYIPKYDWRTWNLSRAQLPRNEQYDEVKASDLPHPANVVANACGMYIGDIKK